MQLFISGMQFTPIMQTMRNKQVGNTTAIKEVIGNISSSCLKINLSANHFQCNKPG